MTDKNGQEEQKPAQRIKSYDYQSWDKFDVVMQFVFHCSPTICNLTNNVAFHL